METTKRFYIGCMDRLVHPDLKDVSLAAALHALADPVRLDIVAKLVECPCLNSTASCPAGTPKSTLSNHINVLRAAGLVETSAEGRERINRLRRADFDARFPGLLDSILANKR
jgi:DNA-binding transcriptional ArsR family regulator